MLLEKNNFGLCCWCASGDKTRSLQIRNHSRHNGTESANIIEKYGIYHAHIEQKLCLGVPAISRSARIGSAQRPPRDEAARYVSIRRTIAGALAAAGPAGASRRTAAPTPRLLPRGLRRACAALQTLGPARRRTCAAQHSDGSGEGGRTGSGSRAPPAVAAPSAVGGAPGADVQAQHRLQLRLRVLERYGPRFGGVQATRQRDDGGASRARRAVVRLQLQLRL